MHEATEIVPDIGLESWGDPEAVESSTNNSGNYFILNLVSWPGKYGKLKSFWRKLVNIGI